MNYQSAINIIEFDFKLFIIFLLASLVLFLLFKKTLTKNKVLNLLLLVLIIAGGYVSYNEKELIPNRYQDSKIINYFQTEYLTGMQFHDIGFESRNDNIIRSMYMIESKGMNLILKYSENEFLLTEETITDSNYMGFELENSPANYSSDIDFDLTFSSDDSKGENIEIEVYNLEGELLEVVTIYNTEKTIGFKNEGKL